MASGKDQVVSWYICTFIALVFLAVRLFVRWRKFQTLFIDDYFLTLAAACLVGDLVIQQYMWNLGMVSIGLASRQNFIQIMQMIIPGSILYVTSLWAIKIALVILYKRVASRTKMQTIYNVALGVLGATWAVIFFDIIFQCYPVDRKWTTDASQSCSTKSSDINYWLTILLNISSDIVIISLPISMVLKLQMPLKQKLGVAGIFALGFFVVMASIVRAYYSKRNETMLTCTVSMIETTVAIIAACLPALRSVFLGQVSRVDTTSAGRHYELSDGSRVGKSTHTKRNGTYVIGGTSKANDSEDELVKETASVSAPSSMMNDSAVQNNHGITLTREYQVYHEDEERREVQ